MIPDRRAVDPPWGFAAENRRGTVEDLHAEPIHGPGAPSGCEVMPFGCVSLLAGGASEVDAFAEARRGWHDACRWRQPNGAIDFGVSRCWRNGASGLSF
ncbi:hypothetical protein Enr13x_05150 [Stieleria neptunia]|uniref:Uncharacterized protein n=1 Tax=Stieleria neptunia TaxID=2527979 RepID=A0A518HIR5_9BACT|nr:hypothetical protein Enr13x_05150 [Stieleria neptunia]